MGGQEEGRREILCQRYTHRGCGHADKHTEVALGDATAGNHIERTRITNRSVGPKSTSKVLLFRQEERT